MDLLCSHHIDFILEMLDTHSLLTARLISLKYKELITKDLMLRRLDQDNLVFRTYSHGNFYDSNNNVITNINERSKSIGYLISDNKNKRMKLIEYAYYARNIELISILIQPPFNLNKHDIKANDYSILRFVIRAARCDILSLFIQEPINIGRNDIIACKNEIPLITYDENIDFIRMLLGPPFYLKDKDIVTIPSIYSHIFLHRAVNILRLFSDPPLNINIKYAARFDCICIRHIFDTNNNLGILEVLTEEPHRLNKEHITADVLRVISQTADINIVKRLRLPPFGIQKNDYRRCMTFITIRFSKILIEAYGE